MTAPTRNAATVPMTAPDARALVRSRRLFQILTFFFWYSLYVYSPYLATYGEGMGIPDGFLGVILGSYGFTQLVLRLPIGVGSDRIRKRKPFVVAGCLLGFASALGMGLFASDWGYLVFRALSGVGASCWVVYTVLYASYFDSRDAAKVMGSISLFNNAGILAAILTGMLLAQFAGERATFFVAAAGGLVALYFSLRVTETVPGSVRPIRPRDILAVLRDRNLLVVSILAAIGQIMVFGTIYGFTPAFAQEKLGAAKWELGLLTAVSTAATVGASYMVSRYAQILKPRRTIMLSMIVVGVACLLVPFCPTIGWLYVVQIIAGFGRSVTMTMCMGQSILTVPDEHRSTAMGTFQAVYAIGIVLGPTIIGFIGQAAGRERGFLVVGLIGLAGSLLGLLLPSPGSARSLRKGA
ncbi:MAG: MFS transporter [Clostridia bacterium]|nr:MFS transporter [Clostridia bacterium]